MGYGDAGVGDEARDEACDFGEVFDAVVDEEDLSAAREFEVDGVADELFAEGREFGLDGLPVGRRGLDDAEVAGAHQ